MYAGETRVCAEVGRAGTPQVGLDLLMLCCGSLAVDAIRSGCRSRLWVFAAGRCRGSGQAQGGPPPPPPAGPLHGPLVCPMRPLPTPRAPCAAARHSHRPAQPLKEAKLGPGARSRRVGPAVPPYLPAAPLVRRPSGRAGHKARASARARLGEPPMHPGIRRRSLCTRTAGWGLGAKCAASHAPCRRVVIARRSLS